VSEVTEVLLQKPHFREILNSSSFMVIFQFAVTKGLATKSISKAMKNHNKTFNRMQTRARNSICSSGSGLNSEL
jgi:nucleoside recognition membrane protein YjiH